MSHNSKQTNFQSNSKGLTAPATISIAHPASTLVTYPDDSPDGDSHPRCYFMKAPGTFAFTDAAGNADSYPVLASQIILLENLSTVTASTTVAFSALY